MDPGNHPNGWEHIDGTTYKLQGGCASKSAAFSLRDVSAFSSSVKLPFSTDLPESYYLRARSAGCDNFLFVMHFDMLPMHLVGSFEVSGAVLAGDAPFERCWTRFVRGDDAYRNARIRMVTTVVKGNWLVKQVIGQDLVAYIGRTIPCTWKVGTGLLECTCDVSASFAMRAVLHLAKRCCRSMVCDLVFVIEGTREDELPERVLGGVRIVHHHMQHYKKVVIQRAVRPAPVEATKAAAESTVASTGASRQRLFSARIGYSFLVGVVCGSTCVACKISVGSLWAMCAILGGVVWLHALSDLMPKQ